MVGLMNYLEATLGRGGVAWLAAVGQVGSGHMGRGN